LLIAEADELSFSKTSKLKGVREMKEFHEGKGFLDEEGTPRCGKLTRPRPLLRGINLSVIGKKKNKVYEGAGGRAPKRNRLKDLGSSHRFKAN